MYKPHMYHLSHLTHSASVTEVNTADMKKRKLESLQFQNEVSDCSCLYLCVYVCTKYCFCIYHLEECLFLTLLYMMETFIISADDKRGVRDRTGI